MGDFSTSCPTEGQCSSWNSEVSNQLLFRIREVISLPLGFKQRPSTFPKQVCGRRSLMYSTWEEVTHVVTHVLHLATQGYRRADAPPAKSSVSPGFVEKEGLRTHTSAPHRPKSAMWLSPCQLPSREPGKPPHIQANTGEPLWIRQLHNKNSKQHLVCVYVYVHTHEGRRGLL